MQPRTRLRRMLWLAALLLGCAQTDDPSAPRTWRDIFQEARLPEDFFWGTASSAYQVEGNYDPEIGPLASNWSRWEELGKITGGQTNPRGSDFYEQWEADLDRHLELGLDAIRIGISWERIEPANDQWHAAGITFYENLVRAAHERGLKVMVTFYHWVVPRWVSDPALPVDDPRRDQFGVPGNRWLWAEFAEFVSQVVPHLAPYVDLYSITNEPWSMITAGYIAGVFPPGDVMNIAGAQALASNLVFMTAEAARVIRALDTVDADGDGVAASIGIAKAASIILPVDPSEPADVAGAIRYNYVFNDVIMNAWVHGDLDTNWDGDTDDTDTVPPEGHYPELAGTLDWMGINFYGPFYALGFETDSIFSALPTPAGGINGGPVSEMGTELRPAAFVATLEYYWRRWGLPIIVTENGIGDCDDDQRARYLTEHLYALGRAVWGEGIDVRGYLQWSLTDNFEWAHGFNQCFGLYAVDFTTFARTKRASADQYAAIVAAGGVTPELWERGFASGYGGRHAPIHDDPAHVLGEIEAEVADGSGHTYLFPELP